VTDELALRTASAVCEIDARSRSGQTVQRIETERVKGHWRIGPFHVSTTEPERTSDGISLGEREYVYDVSAEGVDVTPVATRELPAQADRQPAADVADGAAYERRPKFGPEVGGLRQRLLIAAACTWQATMLAISAGADTKHPAGLPQRRR